MKLIYLLLLLSLNYLRKHYLKTAFAVIGMATGIAIFVTTNIYKETIYKDVRDNEQILMQTEGWMIRSVHGRISEDYIQQIADLGVFERISPRSERTVNIRNHEGEPVSARFAGIDLLKADSERFASDIFDTDKLDEGLPFFGSGYFTASERVELFDPSSDSVISVIDIIPDSPENIPFLVTDISIYQTVFKDRGMVDVLEVEFEKESEKVKGLIGKVSADLIITDQEEYIGEKISLSDAFLVNLQFFSFISMIISVLLIYQFYRFILLDRETDFSKLRAVGISSSDIRSVLISEVLFIGIVSSGLGIAGGYLFSKYSLSIVKSTVETFYFSVGAEDIYLSPYLVGTSLLIGIAATFAAGFHPVVKLIGESRPSGMRQYRKNASGSMRSLYAFIVGIIILCLLYLSGDALSDVFNIHPGGTNVIMLTLGMLLIIPGTVSLLTSLIVRLDLFSALKIKTSASYILRTLIRQSVFILSLAILIGFVISLLIFITSFRATVENWLYQITPADMYIESHLTTMQNPHPLPEGLVGFIKDHPVVEEYDTITRHQYNYRNIPVQLRETDLQGLRKRGRITFRDISQNAGSSPKNEVFVSEPFSNRFTKYIEDEIVISGDRGSAAVRIAGVFYDYTTDAGAIYMDRSLGEEIFSSRHINGVSLWITESRDILQLEGDILSKFPSSNLRVRNQEELRKGTLSLFDRTFRVVWLLTALSIVISVVTIVNSTFMVYLERLTELARLRAVGASLNQLRSVIWSQMSLLSLYTLIISFLLSFGFLMIMVQINRYFFGWTVDVMYDWKPYLISAGMLFLISYLTIVSTFSKAGSSLSIRNFKNE